MSKLFDNNYNSLYEKIDFILYFIDDENIENYQVNNIEMEIISLYNNIKDSKSQKLLNFLIKNIIKMNERPKAVKVILRIKDDKIRLAIIKKMSFFIIENIKNIVNEYERLTRLSDPIDFNLYLRTDAPNPMDSFILDSNFLKRLIGIIVYTHIKEENEIGEKIYYITKDNCINYTIYAIKRKIYK